LSSYQSQACPNMPEQSKARPTHIMSINKLITKHVIYLATH